MVLSPEERHARAVESGRLGGLSKAANRDAREGTKAARSAFLKRFELQVDPDGVLPPAERLRRAIAARKLHMARLYMKQKRSRAARGQLKAAETAA